MSEGPSAAMLIPQIRSPFASAKICPIASKICSIRFPAFVSVTGKLIRFRIFSCKSHKITLQPSRYRWTPISFGALGEILRRMGFRPFPSVCTFSRSSSMPFSRNSLTMFETVILASPVFCASSIRELHSPVAISFNSRPRFFCFKSLLFTPVFGICFCSCSLVQRFYFIST